MLALPSVKRLLDLAVIVGLLPLWGPVLAGLLLLLIVTGGAPLHGQLRVGQQGQVFRLWKLRSMRRGAAGQLAGLLADPALRREWIAHGKLRHDPRITRFGHWMRRHSLDELPQIWNVIRGDMALVGPRPLLPEELAREYGPAAQAVLSVPPGMTGPWQVAGRNDLRYADRLRLDLAYVQGCRAGRWLRQDLAILARTVITILWGTGR